MVARSPTHVSRRRFLKRAGAAVVGISAGPAVIIPGRAQRKTLRILQWKHFVPGHDEWFDGTFIREWGEKNDTEVVVDHVGLGEMPKRAAAEAAAGQGHDLVMLLTPTPVYEDRVIDHREVVEEAERRYGRAVDYVYKSVYNPKTEKYFGFCTNPIPAVLTYRQDLWDAVGVAPTTWADVLRGGRRIKLLHERPVGISLAPEHNGNYSLRAILYSFGSSVQDADGNPALKSKQTLEAIRYVKALFEEAMSRDVLSWDAASNNRYLLADEGSLTLDTISIVRAAESKALPVNEHLHLAPLPAGPDGVAIGPAFGFLTYMIWTFAENVDGAKQFLVDLVGSSRAAFLASGFQNMPSYPDTIPDMAELVAGDAAGTPTGRYDLLSGTARWNTNAGYPGFTNAAVDEVFAKGLVPTMFAAAARGALSPEAALDVADAEVKRIFEQWRERGKV